MSKAGSDRFHRSDSCSSLCGSRTRSGSLAQVCQPGRASVCNICRRSILHPSPTPNTVEGPYVSLTSSTLGRCKSCRAFLRSCVPGEKAQFFEKMQGGDKRETEFLPTLAQYDKLRNDTFGCFTHARDEVHHRGVLTWSTRMFKTL